MPCRVMTLWAATTVGALLLGGAMQTGTPVRAQLRDPKPHILLIVADDLGWRDVGYHGGDVHTPHLDRLALNGARLESHYAHPQCTPTRAALLTGRYPWRYGLQTAGILRHATWGLPTDERVLPQALKTAGYRTALVGKWHLGHADKAYWPTHRGFDSFYGHLAGSIGYFSHEDEGRPDWYRNDMAITESGYATTLLGHEAARIVRAHDPRTPLFLYLAFNAPHSPYEAPKEYEDRYLDVADPLRRVYAAMITAMDDAIGGVLTALDESGMRQHTLIIFQSDNGGATSPRSSGRTPSDNTPYRGGKVTLWEGGVRVPAFATWPGHIAAGTVVTEPTHTVDWFATFMMLAGGLSGAGKDLDGRDIWDTMTDGARSPHDDIPLHVEMFRAGLRQGQWKLVWFPLLPQRILLYDLSADPGEQRNLASEHPSKVDELRHRLELYSHDMAPSLFLEHDITPRLQDYLRQLKIGDDIEIAPTEILRNAP